MARGQGDLAAARSLLEQSVAIWRELGNKRGIAISLNPLGHVAREEGDYVAAAASHRESLTVRRELGDKKGVAECLEGLAAGCGAQKQPRRAAHLFGAAKALRAAIGVPLPPNERDRYDREVAALREALGEEAFAAAWAAGRAMTLEEAVAYALEGPAE